MLNECRVDDCYRVIYAHGWCRKHYQRWRRNGNATSKRPKGRKPRAPVERFWAKVIKSDNCWLWSGKPNNDGYGIIILRKGISERAHRFSWIVHYGAIPKGMCVCHHCDNPACARPDHLYLGTIGDNNRDRSRKHRSAMGERVPSAKLTIDDVRAIRATYAKGTVSMRELARRFGCLHPTISHIVNGRSWRSVI